LNFNKSASSRLKFYGGILISAIFIYVVFARLGIDYEDFFARIKELSFLDIIALICLYLIPYPVRAIRAQLLLRNLSFNDSLGGVFVGYAANNILPFRMGEVVRAAVVGKRAKERKTTVLASVFIERIFDGFAIVILLLIGASKLNLPDWAAQARILGLAFFCSSLVGLLFVGFTGNFWEKFIPKGKIGSFVQGLFDGIKLATQSVSQVLFLLVLSFFIWGFEGFMYWYGFSVFNLAGTTFDSSFLNSLFVLGVVNLGVLLPSSPGYVGVFEWFTINSLSVFKVGTSSAAAYATIIHLLQFIPVTLIGLGYFIKYGLSSISALSKSISNEDLLT
jgi:glycosyltransferase 2 family protein